eukprot:GEMP01014495.1.p1 GENE.GEMP01014495.1~~GEMP01014495.1.p1  ORF type:complete len:305 (+),score=20.90 GEMP01014495.1:163-1077(+)
MEPIVGDKFSVGRKLGAGSFGEVRLGKNIETGQQVAIKLESAKTKNPQLLLEFRIYELIAGGKGVPQVHWYGVHSRYNVLVLDLLGQSLEDAFQATPKKRCSLLSVVCVGIQMISLVEYLHGKNFLHRDIKPDNFMLGIGDNNDQLYIIDLGLSKKYKSSRTGEHIAYREGKNLTGTARYASINTHRGLEQSRRDDLESVGYVLLYVLKGILPWQGLQIKANEDRYVKIMEKKMSTQVAELCKGNPDEFATYLNYCKALKFEERPNYESLRGLMKDMATRNGYNFGNQKTPNGISLRELIMSST